MSVQVKRRREAASFLASFVGAQAELIVDTTNNRVQVHDGTTPGGWPAARLAEVVTNTRATVADAAYAALATDRLIAYTSLTAARVVTLPAASAYPTGTCLVVVDETGSCSATKTITLARAGTDAINGATSAVISSAYGYLAVESNGSNAWTIIDQSTLSLAQQGAGAVAITGGTIDNTAIGATSPAAASVTAPAIGDSSVRAVTSAWYGQNLPGGFLNRFRNGAMDIWQRGTGALTVTTAGAYTADGWIVVPTGASVTAAQAGGRLLTKASLQITGAASVTDVTVKQRIESYIAAALASQTVTVQAQVYNNTGASLTPTLTVKHAGSQDVWTSPTTDVSAVGLQACANGAWTQIAYTFAVNASSYQGLEITFDFGNNFSATGKSIQLTEFDIRTTPGVATGLNGAPPPPELRPIAAELAFNQRYFETSYSAGAAPGTPGSSAGALIQFLSPLPSATYAGLFSLTYKATKCAVATVVAYSGATGASGVLRDGANLADVTATIIDSGTSGFSVSATASAANTKINMQLMWAASAEL